MRTSLLVALVFVLRTPSVFARRGVSGRDTIDGISGDFQGFPPDSYMWDDEEEVLGKEKMREVKKKNARFNDANASHPG